MMQPVMRRTYPSDSPNYTDEHLRDWLSGDSLGSQARAAGMSRPLPPLRRMETKSTNTVNVDQVSAQHMLRTLSVTLSAADDGSGKLIKYHGFEVTAGSCMGAPPPSRVLYLTALLYAWQQRDASPTRASRGGEKAQGSGVRHSELDP